ncbi:MAG: anhydro-N-acetylmuramic acid kinase [Chitinophagaceae bacterium]
MLYKVIGLMSGSSLDGLDIVFTELQEATGGWRFEILAADCYTYTGEWTQKLKEAIHLNALDYQLLHTEYGAYLGKEVNRFIEAHDLHYKVALVASHGHTSFHEPLKKMTAQLGDGAALAAQTKGIVVSDLRALDVAFGGQGAPIVPIGEKLLFPDYQLFLNIGGIANLTATTPHGTIAFDVCAANRVLDMLMNRINHSYDEGGKMAATGSVHSEMLERLNDLDYYRKPYPKSLANSFGTDTVYPIIISYTIPVENALRTYVEHVAIQVAAAIGTVADASVGVGRKLLVTGGGAFNTFLVKRLSEALQHLSIEVVVPDENLVRYKEALVMALSGVLRWRQEYNVLSSVTGAERNSIGGAVWIGQEA